MSTYNSSMQESRILFLYVAGAFRNDKLFWIQISSQEVSKNCQYVFVCNLEAISLITVKHGHFVHLGVFKPIKLSKKSFVWQSYGRKFTHD